MQANDGALLIAKFPHHEDEWDVVAWEKWALDLADASGIATPRRELTQVGGRNVLLVERFDHGALGSRVGYISAMTLLGSRDGDERDYLDIAETIPEQGAFVNADLRELYRRVVFNVAIHDVDDHLRNHGLLRAPGGLTLSPIFDVNPHPDASRPRVTSIGGAVDADDEVEALLDVARSFRLNQPEAASIIGDVFEAVSQWRDVADRNGIHHGQQAMFAPTIADRLISLQSQLP